MDRPETRPTREDDVALAPPEDAPAEPIRSGEFLCPNGCGPMLRRRCKLSCQRCGYYDSCSDFC